MSGWSGFIATIDGHGWRLIAAGGLVAAPWRNGLGVTREIAGRVGADGGLLWQIGLADLRQDADFSYFPHCDRLFTPVEGDPPPALSIAGGAFRACPLLVPFAFPGDVATTSRIGSPGRAFNVVWDRRSFRGAVEVGRLGAGDAVVVRFEGEVVIHCLEGRVAVAGELLGSGDSVVGRGVGEPGAAAEDSLVIVAGVRANGVK